MICYQRDAGYRPMIARLSVDHNIWLVWYLRGFFKKFWYEPLAIRKYKVCSTDFQHKYFSFYHACTCEISKESSKYQYSYWHLKWPQSYTLAYIWRWKGENVEIQEMLFSQIVALRWKVCPKNVMGNKFLSIILNLCYCNTGLRICKGHTFSIEDYYPKRRPVSYITK